MKYLALSIWLVTVSTAALAAGFTIQTPGGMPSNAKLKPDGRGGYIVEIPGKAPLYIKPDSRGGATLQRPGQMPSKLTPNAGQGFTLNTPGQAPSSVSRNNKGGISIDTPGQNQKILAPW